MDSLEEFRSLLVSAEFIDDRYDATGSHVWLPYGLELRDRMLTLFEEHFEGEDYDQYEFPTLIPESYLQRQEDAVMSFEDSVCWVDRFGTEELEEPYYLRPTGEAQVYPMVELWVRSYRDLPLKLLLVQPMFRAFKGGTPLLASQGTHMIEGHGFFRDRSSAEREVEAATRYVAESLSALGLAEPLLVERPLWGNLPVSERIVGFDIVTPLGRTIMAASLYMQGELYSEPYGLEYRDDENELRTMTTIDWGMSTRVLGIALLLLADDRGFRVLPNLSPVQVVFVPINGNEDEISRSETLATALPFRTEIDRDTGDLGKRFEEWEQKGVPLRVEIGPDELDDDVVTIYRRDLNERVELKPESVESFVASVEELLGDLERNLREAVSTVRERHVKEVEDLDSIAEVIEDGGVAQFNYCGSKECGLAIEERTNGEILGTDLELVQDGSCVDCRTDTNQLAYASSRF